MLRKGEFSRLLAPSGSGAGQTTDILNHHIHLLRNEFSKNNYNLVSFEQARQEVEQPSCCIILDEIQNIQLIPKEWRCKKILIVAENEFVRPRNWDRSIWQRADLVLSWKRNIKWDNYRAINLPNFSLEHVPSNLDAPDKRKFSCSILAKKPSRHKGYRLRSHLIHSLEKHSVEFDLFGHGWEKFALNNRMLRWLYRKTPFVNQVSTKAPKAYKGPVDDKLLTLKNYKFSFIIENELVESFLTEKLFHCFLTSTVPIYLGATNIEKLVPPDLFIDAREFIDDGEISVSRMLELLSKTESKLPQITADIREYIHSGEAAKFSNEHWVSEVLSSTLDIMNNS